MKKNIRDLRAAILIGLVMQGCNAPSIQTSLRVHADAKQGEEVVLPTRRCGDFFIVDALIGGGGPYPLLLDTGAGTTILSPRVTEATGASRRMESIEIDAFLATGSIPCKTKPVQHLRRALGVHIEGILAYGVFEGMLLTYDYAAGEVRLREGSFSAEELEGPGVVATSEGTRPFVRGATNAVDFTILVDTGSNGALALSQIERFEFETALRPTNGHMRIDGLYIDKAARLKGPMTIGPMHLERPVLKTAATVSTVGQKILRHFELTFDQAQHRMRFRRVEGEPDDAIRAPSIYGMGAVFTPKEDRLIVRRLFGGSAAAAAGLRVDDEILAINGESIADRNCGSESLRSGAPRRLELRVERGGREVTLAVMTGLLVE